MTAPQNMTGPATVLNTAATKPQFRDPAAGPGGLDFGPDFSQTAHDPPLTAPKINEKHPPKPGAGLLKNLGQNKKLRSEVRKLTEDDLSKLSDWYRRIGKVLAVIRPPIGAAMVLQADDCAQAWGVLADKNDKVRRGILAFVEGGAWGAVATAHLPIVMAAIPEQVLNSFLLKGMGMFAASVSEEDSDADTAGPSPYVDFRN
jgi:hypothetical protein